MPKSGCGLPSHAARKIGASLSLLYCKTTVMLRLSESLRLARMAE